MKRRRPVLLLTLLAILVSDLAQRLRWRRIWTTTPDLRFRLRPEFGGQRRSGHQVYRESLSLVETFDQRALACSAERSSHNPALDKVVEIT